MRFRFRRSRELDTALTLHDASYDAQADLALPDAEADYPPDGFVPYAGMLVEGQHGAGYDAQRDTGLDL